MAYMLLEVESIPREARKCQALINQARYDYKRAKLRRAVCVVVALALAALLWWRLVDPVNAAPVWGIIAYLAGGFFVVWCLRRVVRTRRSRPTMQPAEGGMA